MGAGELAKKYVVSTVKRKIQAGVAIGGLLTGGIYGAAKAAEYNPDALPHLETTLQADAGHATVKTLNLKLDKQEIVGYTAHADLSQVTAETKLHIASLAIPLGISWTEKFSGDIKAAICQKPSQVVATYDADKHTAAAQIPLSALSICTKTDLTKTPVRAHETGLGVAPMESVMVWAKALPKVDQLPGVAAVISDDDAMTSRLQTYAEINAHELAAKKCGPKVWAYDELRKAYRERVAEQIAAYVGLVDPAVTPDRVTVYVGAESSAQPDLPQQDLGYATDYDNVLASVRADKDIKLLDPNFGSCDMATNLQVVNSDPTASPTASGASS